MIQRKGFERLGRVSMRLMPERCRSLRTRNVTVGVGFRRPEVDQRKSVDPGGVVCSGPSSITNPGWYNS